MVHTFNSSTQEADDISELVQGQPGVQSEFQDSQHYTKKPYLEKQTKQTKKNKKKKKNAKKIN